MPTYPSDPKNLKYPNIFVCTLKQSLAVGGNETEIILSSVKTLEGVPVPMDSADFKFTGRGVLSVDVQSVSRAEFISFTGVDAPNKKVTGAIRGLSFRDDSVIATNKKFHAVGAPIIIAFGTHNLRDIEKLVANAGPTNTGIVRLTTSPNVVLGNPAISVANPCVVTLNGHGLTAGDQVVFTTTGGLPTGIIAGDVYYVSAVGLTLNTFEITTRLDDDLYIVITTGVQSGVHTLTRVTPYVGAGGGHIIEDDGVPLPQETALDFENYFDITDDPGVKTKVNINTTELGADPDLGTALGGNTNLINSITANATFQTLVNSFVTGGGGVITQIDQTPDNGTYGTLGGNVDGMNTTFTVSTAKYLSGKLEVFLNGLIQLQGATDDWVETVPGSGTFDFNVAPPVGSIVTVVYQIAANPAQVLIQFEDETGGALGTPGTVDEFEITGPGITGARAGDKVTYTYAKFRVLPLSSNSATPAIDTDNYDVVHITAQTVAITSMTTGLTGTPKDGDTLRISITGTGAVAITWGAKFEASTVALPATTTGTDRLDVGFFWNSETSKWRCVGVS